MVIWRASAFQCAVAEVAGELVLERYVGTSARALQIVGNGIPMEI